MNYFNCENFKVTLVLNDGYKIFSDYPGIYASLSSEYLWFYYSYRKLNKLPTYTFCSNAQKSV